MTRTWRFWRPSYHMLERVSAMQFYVSWPSGAAWEN
ncbi:hypothetical protein SPHINGOAX6_50070 [Sphingomonas sp. AX6]|nr:hypothetical protein SPHINGOAX6_50070 [Sphingomonas sp. AX6]